MSERIGVSDQEGEYTARIEQLEAALVEIREALQDVLETSINPLTPEDFQRNAAAFDRAAALFPQGGTGKIKNAIWFCKIGEADRRTLPTGSDWPMRQAVERAYREITGQDAEFTFSGWAGRLNKAERDLVERDRDRR